MHILPAWLQRLLRQCGGTAPLFYALPWMMVLLIFATTRQKQVGLHDAVGTFLDSWILWIGPLLLPGGLPMLLLAMLSLLARLAFFSHWEWRQAGSLLAHLGALLLLGGSWYVSVTAQEGFIALREGETQGYAESYTQWQLVLFSKNRPIHRWQLEELEEGAELARGALRLTVTEACEHCALLPGPGMGSSKDYAEMFRLDPDAPAPVLEEERSPALTFTHDGKPYLLHALLPKSAAIEGTEYTLRMRRARQPLPFTLTLTEFTRQTYPGSDQAREYASTVQAEDASGAGWRQVISMNEPLRHAGYAVYQSSYMQTPETEISILAVVKNRFWLMPYLAGGLMAFGLLLHAFLRRAGTLAAACLLLLAALPLPGHAAAPQMPDLSAFRHIPVAHEGRIKPLDSFARDFAARFGGVESDPVQWLALTLFDPVQAARQTFIDVGDEGLRSLLALPVRPGNRYAPSEIAVALQAHAAALQKAVTAPEEALSTQQRQLVALHGNLRLYQQLAGSLTLLLPLDMAVSAEAAATLGLQGPPPHTYRDLRRVRQQVLAGAQREADEATAQSAMLPLANLMRLLEAQGSQPQWLRILPSPWQEAQWSAPWEIAINGQGSPRSERYLLQWEAMAAAWRSGDREGFAASSEAALTQATSISGTPYWRLRAETFYTDYHPLYWAGALYLLSLLALVLANRHVPLTQAARLMLAGGLLLHVLAMGLRVAIMQRPPVANLHESILFVAAIAAGYGLFRQAARQRMAIGASLAFVLLLASIGFTPEGDTLLITLAVLNTNFWLTVHVLCITAGYAACLLAAAQAHLWLWQADPMRSSPLPLTLVALALTAIGTWLGGIWADQSWGRFWGWDPKENGALLIVLWLVWLLHGRIGRHLSPLTYHAGLALTALIVALSWFGVNLLSVGLHAYGFTDRAAWGLLAFAVAELAAVTILAYRFTRIHGEKTA